MTFTKRSLQILINRFLSFPHVTEEKSTFLRDKRCHFYQFLFTLSAAFLPCQKVSLGGTSFRPLLGPGYFPLDPRSTRPKKEKPRKKPAESGAGVGDDETNSSPAFSSKAIFERSPQQFENRKAPSTQTLNPAFLGLWVKLRK